jgi:hypothetical protein
MHANTGTIVTITRRKDRRQRHAQEPGDERQPDIECPPDSDNPDFDSDGPEAPPPTKATIYWREGSEHAGRTRKPPSLRVM